MGLRKNIAQFGTIFLINLAVKEFIDLVINPILMFYTKYFISTIITIIIYIIFGIISVKIYDYYKERFSVIEINKKTSDIIQNENVNSLITLIKKYLRYIKTFFFELFLSMQNPGLFVLYRRDESGIRTGFQGKNVKLMFVIYIIIINIAWNAIILIIIKAIKDLFGIS